MIFYNVFLHAIFLIVVIRINTQITPVLLKNNLYQVKTNIINSEFTQTLPELR